MRFSVASGTDNAALRSIRDIGRVYGFVGFQVVRQFFGVSTLGPHGTTQRLAYTVPADKLARVEMLVMDCARITTGSPNGVSEWQMFHTPDGGAASRFARVGHVLAAAGDSWEKTLYPGIRMVEGDALDLSSFDSGSAGTVNFSCSWVISEVDL